MAPSRGFYAIAAAIPFARPGAVARDGQAAEIVRTLDKREGADRSADRRDPDGSTRTSVEIHRSARKHGFADADMLHAIGHT